MDAVPDAIDPAAVLSYLAAIPGVKGVHDLHIWAMSTTETALTVHLVVGDGIARDDLLATICEGLHEDFEIHHATIQFEQGGADFTCVLEPAHVV
jgi:cobalt-zinc-cadmium efflux system protein